MELMGEELHSFFGKIPVYETLLDVAGMLVPIWLAVMVGLIVGWSWKPRWASFIVIGLRNRTRLVWSTPPGFGARRLWLALTAVTAFQMMKKFWVKFKAWKWPTAPNLEIVDESISPASFVQSAVTIEDFRDLYQRVECQDGGPTWQNMMEKTIPGMSYQAWRREPQSGPTEYRSRTIFEDVTPEIMRDFFWDDEFRPVWDDMLIYSKSLEGCTQTGSEIVHWVRKFPFFCSDREYLIGRRIWEFGGAYFCITKSVPYTSIPRRSKPRRVDTFYSSWCIRAVESRKRDGRLTACEVTLFHHEAMGIPREIAKFGVQHGMWGCVKRMEPGLREYQAVRKSLKPLSYSALMARINTEVPSNVFRELGLSPLESVEYANTDTAKHSNFWKWLIVGGAVALACGLDKGVVGKVVVFGIARRLGKLGRKL